MTEPSAPGLLHTPFSQYVQAGGMRWHVQRTGQGPVLLLLHGTASASHSWRHLLPALARQFTVIAPDLPGHGLSGDPGISGLSLPGMARMLAHLLQHLGVQPAVLLGHSAGAALAVRMCLDGVVQPGRVIALNGALLPPLGMPLHLFSPLAKLLAVTPLVPHLFSLRARGPLAVERLLDGTGSRLDPAMLTFYRRLLGEAGHVSGALRMMAWWDLPTLAQHLPALQVPLDLLVAERDRIIPPAEAARIRALLPQARVVVLPGLGHLAHEEDPATCLRAVQACLTHHEPQECMP